MAGRYRPNANDQSLDPWCKISEVWPQQPPNPRLDIFVDVSDGVDIVALGSGYFILLSFPIPTCRFSTFLYGDHVIFTVEEMQPTHADRTEFTMTLPSRDNWRRLSEEDLAHNKVTRGWSSHLREFEERLRRKRYIDAVQDVRTVVACCRPTHLRCSRHMRLFGRSGSSQRLRTLISRASSQWKLAIWTT